MAIGKIPQLAKAFQTNWAMESTAFAVLEDAFKQAMSGELILSTDNNHKDHMGIHLERVSNGIFSMDIEGTLVPRAYGLDAMCGMVGMHQITEAIYSMHEDQEIKVLVLKINSPGGTVIGTPELAKAIKESPFNTVAYVDEYACSGAYWIASACDKIVATESAILGSIGVYTSRVQFGENKNVKRTFFSAGSKKLQGNPHTEMSEQEAKAIQDDVNKTYEWFTKSVAENRNVDVSLVKETEAGVFNSKDAPAWMVDHFMSYNDFIKSLND